MTVGLSVKKAEKKTLFVAAIVKKWVHVDCAGTDDNLFRCEICSENLRFHSNANNNIMMFRYYREDSMCFVVIFYINIIYTFCAFFFT